MACADPPKNCCRNCGNTKNCEYNREDCYCPSTHSKSYFSCWIPNHITKTKIRVLQTPTRIRLRR
jgi:hypothetical protein